MSPAVVRGADELAAKMQRIAGRLEQPAGAEPLLTNVFRDRIAHVFSSDGEGTWAGHAADTIDRWGAHPLMRLTGALEAALTGGRAAATGAQIRYEPESDLFYGAIAAASRPITVSSGITDDIAVALADHIFEGET